MKYYVNYWKEFFNFAGKANRLEFWIPWLINTAIGAVLSIISIYVNALTVLTGIFGFAMLIPSLSIFWRRMHDTGRSGWNILWILLPLVGWIIILVFLFDRSK